MTNAKLADVLRRNQVSIAHDLKWAAMTAAAMLVTLATLIG